LNARELSHRLLAGTCNPELPESRNLETEITQPQYSLVATRDARLPTYSASGCLRWARTASASRIISGGLPISQRAVPQALHFFYRPTLSSRLATRAKRKPEHAWMEEAEGKRMRNSAATRSERTWDGHPSQFGRVD